MLSVISTNIGLIDIRLIFKGRSSMNGSNGVNQFKFNQTYPGPGHVVKQVTSVFPAGQGGLPVSNNPNFNGLRSYSNSRSASMTQLPETQANVINVNGKLHLLATSAVCQTQAQNPAVYWNSNPVNSDPTAVRPETNFNMRIAGGGVEGSRVCPAGQLLGNLRRFNSPSSFNIKNGNAKDASKCSANYPNSTLSQVKTEPQPNYFSNFPTSTSTATSSSQITSSQLNSSSQPLSSNAIYPVDFPSDLDNGFMQTGSDIGSMDPSLTFPFADSTSLGTDLVSDDLHRINLDPGLLLPDNTLLTGPISDGSQNLYECAPIALEPSTPSVSLDQVSSHVTRTLSSSSMNSSVPLSLPDQQHFPSLSSPANSPRLIAVDSSIRDFDFSKQFSVMPDSQDETSTLSSPLSNRNPPSQSSLVEDLDLDSDAFVGLEDNAHFSQPLSDSSSFDPMTIISTNQIHAPGDNSAIFTPIQSLTTNGDQVHTVFTSTKSEINPSLTRSSDSAPLEINTDSDLRPNGSSPSIIDLQPTVVDSTASSADLDFFLNGDHVK